jgi:hypothetical protein
MSVCSPKRNTVKKTFGALHRVRREHTIRFALRVAGSTSLTGDVRVGRPGSIPGRSAIPLSPSTNESHSAPKRSESGSGRHGLTCGIARHPACSGDSSGKTGKWKPLERQPGPEMGNRKSSGCYLGRVLRGRPTERRSADSGKP